MQLILIIGNLWNGSLLPGPLKLQPHSYVAQASNSHAAARISTRHRQARFAYAKAPKKEQPAKQKNPVGRPPGDSLGELGVACELPGIACTAAAAI
eukprot:1144235-Pelagomonas_calceolata.AAC.3